MRISSQIWGFNVKSIFVGGIAGLAVIAFAVTGFGGRLGNNFDSSVAAHVGSQNVSIRTLNEMVQEYERQQGDRGDAERRKANVQTALNQLVREKVLLEEATRTGWTATDLEVANWIRSIPAFQDETTKQFKQELYQRFLKSGRMSTLELFQSGRESIGRAKIQAVLTTSLPTPEALLKGKYTINNTEFEAEYVEVKPSIKALDSAIATAAQKYASDEGSLKILEESYEKAKAEFQHKAQIRISSLLVAWKEAARAQGEALKRTKDEARSLTEGLLKRIQSGEKFSAVAADTNDDPLAKSKGGDLGFLDETQIDPATFQAAKALSQTNRLSQVVETPFGFRIMEFTDSRPEQNKSFEEAKLELARRKVETEIRHAESSALQLEFQKTLAAKDSSQLEALLAKHNLNWVKLPKPVSARERFIEGLGVADSLVPALFSLKKTGDVAENLINITGRNFAFRLLGRKNPPEPTPEQLTELANMEQALFARNFQQETERKLYEVYTREQEIRINPALHNLE
jgi:peptidyl-prolyl cis-trans isomerase D